MQRNTHIKFMSGSDGSSTWWGKKESGIEVKDTSVNEFRAYWMLVPVNVVAIKQLESAEERRNYHLKELRELAQQIITKLYADFKKYEESSVALQRNHETPNHPYATHCRSLRRALTP